MSDASPPTTRTAPPRTTSRSTDLALISFFAAFIAVCAIVPAVPVGSIGVPITLQTLGVALAGACLGARRGTLAVLLYICVGLAGVPIFAGGGGGFAVLAGPSVGYIAAWPLSTLVIGYLVARIPAHRIATSVPLIFGCIVIGSILISHPIGIAGIVARADVPWCTAIAGDLVFVPGDLVKSALAAIVAASVHRTFPDLLPRRR